MQLHTRTSITDHSFAVFGAAGGIGSAIARHLAEHGAFVCCADVSADRVEKVTSDITAATGAKAQGAVVDVTDQSSIEAALDRAAALSGSIQGVINCVGITGATGRPSAEVDYEDFVKVTEVNLLAAFRLSQEALRRLVPAGYGRIVHLASIAGKEGNAGMVAYSASKAGLIGMVKSQGKEYATSGVTVNAIAPAVIWTPLVDALPDAQVKYMTDKIPMQRCGSLEEIADLVGWIVSPAASFTTGFTFDLSGGRATY